MTLLTVENLSLLQTYQPILKSNFFLFFRVWFFNNTAILYNILYDACDCECIQSAVTISVCLIKTRSMHCFTGFPTALWTSASSDGQYCALERTFAWCTTGNIVNETYINDTQLWASKPDGSESAGNCVTLSLNKDETSAQLSLAACTESKKYMCQVLKFNS